MRFIGRVGAATAVLGLLAGVLGLSAATNIIQEMFGALCIVCGMLGLVTAVLGFGLASIRDVLRSIDKNLAPSAPADRLEIREWRPAPQNLMRDPPVD